MVSRLIWRLAGQLLLEGNLQSLVSAHGPPTLEIGGIFRLDALCVQLLYALAMFWETAGFSRTLRLGLGLLPSDGLLQSSSRVGSLLFWLRPGLVLSISLATPGLPRFGEFGRFTMSAWDLSVLRTPFRSKMLWTLGMFPELGWPGPMVLRLLWLVLTAWPCS